MPTCTKIIHFFPFPSPQLEHFQSVSVILDRMTHRQLFFLPPLRHSCSTVRAITVDMKGRRLARHPLLFPLTSLMRNIFQRKQKCLFFFFLLIAFKWITRSEEEREKKGFRFVWLFCEFASSRDAGYSISHTRALPIVSICLIL